MTRTKSAMGRLKAAPTKSVRLKAAPTISAPRPLLLCTAVVVAALVAGCSGGFTVTPTGPSGTPLPPPITISFRGTLADGGTFEGKMTYGTRDQDDRPGYGRYTAAGWDVTVHGGTFVEDTHFSEAEGGRALVETYNDPFAAIGVNVIWPKEDPAQKRLTPHVDHPATYNPDTQPKLSDFGTLLAPIYDRSVGTFEDTRGARTVITSFSVQ
jgi:hypothetical protein